MIADFKDFRIDRIMRGLRRSAEEGFEDLIIREH
jgi:hypothetical protein